MKYFDETIKVENTEIHFLDNKVNSDKLIVIFPPGIQDARFIFDLELNETFNSYRIISITPPSRYKSSKLDAENSLENLSIILRHFLEKFLTDNKFKSIKLVGFSFGTAIITQIMQSENLIEREKISLILINPGEFIDSFIKPILLRVFNPALKSIFYAKFLRFVVCNIFSSIFKLEYFPNDRIFKINEQWLSTLNYEINTDKVIYNDTIIFEGENDNIIEKASKSKIEKIYKNSRIIKYKGTHILNYKTDKEYQLIKEKLLTLL